MADHKLSTYQAKRDFGITAEPSGDTKVAPANRPRFVIQKHDATRLHYDLRLEVDGVFKSWAVTRGPSLDPHDKRLAVEVEDHPLDYGDFEGTIPKGQYGGGSVMLWDRGYWEPEGMTAEEGLTSGDLKFTLDGDRLHGSWVLVRMKGDKFGGKRTNWLLIKHQDAYAQVGDHDALLEDARSVASGRPMEDIADGKGKGPEPFITAKAARGDAVWRSRAEVSALPGFVPPQLAVSLDRPPRGSGWGHEIKFDGYRMQLRVQDGRSAMLTRKGLDWTARFPAIAKAGLALPDGLYDGEVCALNAAGSPDFPALQAALSDGAADTLIYFVFDALYSGGENLRPLPLVERKARLKALTDDLPAASSRLIRYVDHFAAAGQAVLESACRMDLEGIISKKLDAPYRSGRSETWAKSKCRAGHEVVIGGWSGEGAQLRSLLVGVRRDGRLVYLGRVGAGFGRETVERVLPRLKAVEAKDSPFSGPNAPKTETGLHWARPELVAEIQYGGWTGAGILRQASFKGLREDKPADDVDAADPVPAGQAELKTPAPKPAAKPGKTPPEEAVVMGVGISNPDKVLWPDDGAGQPVTKIELARYYEAVGAWMMPHIKGRPCSIIRAPDGIEKQLFFQRHGLPGTSALLELVTVEGDRKPYLQIDRIEGLAAVAQTGAAELHLWNCEPFKPQVPGRLVFDLDPAPDVDFDEVIAAARDVRDKLEDLGLISFCKTTGGKGLHVVTPLAQPPKSKSGIGELNWPEAKAFAQEVCSRMADAEPNRFVVNMSKKLRNGRIFLDYLRNDRMSTAVAPLSPRARPGAPVSMPLTWSQVKAGLDPKAYTIRTAPALIEKSTAWRGYCDSERPLGPAIKRLKGS